MKTSFTNIRAYRINDSIMALAIDHTLFDGNFKMERSCKQDHLLQPRYGLCHTELNILSVVFDFELDRHLIFSIVPLFL